ncbi:hypothetical protein ACWEOZ_21940, partial [Actinoplanes sp. NPDC004185]
GVRMSGREYRLGDFAQVWHRQGRRSWSAVAGRPNGTGRMAAARGSGSGASADRGTAKSERWS